jgi:hypothetical protein
VDEPDTDEPLEKEKEQAGEEPDPNGKESELDEEIEPNEVPDESKNGSEKSKPEGEAGVKQGETEWPEIGDFIYLV